MTVIDTYHSSNNKEIIKRYMIQTLSKQKPGELSLNMKSIFLVITVVLIGAPFLITSAKASIMFSDHCALVLNETMHISVDNATKICYKPNGNSSTAPL